VQAILTHHSSHMVTDQQLLECVLGAAEQGERPAAFALAVLTPRVLQRLDYGLPTCITVFKRVTALLAGGTAAGAAFLAAALQEEGTLGRLPGMVEAACSGLLDACRKAGAVDASTSTSSSSKHNEELPCLVDLPPAHAVLLQYLRGLVGVVLHLATTVGPPLGSSLMGLDGPLVPALAEALSLLLSSLQLRGNQGSFSLWSGHHQGQRPYHDAAWGALLAFSVCPWTLAALLQHQPGLLAALAVSWDQLLDTKYCEEPADNAARLAACLLLSGSIPGQEERRQQEQLLVAAVRLWDMAWPEYWHGQGDRLLQLLELPHGPKAVVGAPRLMDALCACYAWDTGEDLLNHEQQWECFALLLDAPDFHTWLVEGLRRGSETCLTAVQAVLGEVGSELTLALLAVPGLGDALVQCCSIAGSSLALDWFFGDALGGVELQEYLGQHPALLQALVARLLRKLDSGYFWSCLVQADSDEWLLQQPVLLDAVVHELVGSRSHCQWTGEVVGRLLGVAPSPVSESLLRQPSAVEELLRVFGRRCQQQQPPQGAPANQQDWPRLLLGELAKPQLAPRALLLLPGLLAQGDAELSAGVFEAMNVIQSHIAPGTLDWVAELAATCSRGGAVLCAEEQLPALQQGVEQVQMAIATAAAAMQQLQEQQQEAAAAAGASGTAGECFLGCSGPGSSTLNHGGDSGVQQQGQQVDRLQAAQAQQVGSSSSQRKGRCWGAAGQRLVPEAGSPAGAGGRVVTRRASSAHAAAAAAGGGGGGGGGVCGGSGVHGAEAPPVRKRTRR
jgi:hypothetical protein